jgi:hypothetical protein
MPEPGGCSSSGGRGGSGGGAGPNGGDAKDLPQLLLRAGVAVTLSVAGLLFSRRQRPPRQQHLLPPPPPPSGTCHEQICSACEDGASIANCAFVRT